jgi:maleamate amidohydrolase
MSTSPEHPPGKAVPWGSYLSSTEREVIQRGRYGTDQPLGQRVCLLLVDIQRSVVGLDRPILDQIAPYPSGVGESAWRAVRRLAPVVEQARRRGILIVYTRLVTQEWSQGQIGLYGRRIDRQPIGRDDPGAQIVPTLSPQGGDIVLEKNFASAFLGTPLASLLVQSRIDTILLAGGSTSGCVRATAVDAASLGYRVAVIEEGTFDRIAISHAASLLDIWMKYGAVLPIDEVEEYLNSRPTTQRRESEQAADSPNER